MNWVSWLLHALVRGYQLLLRPLFPAACRYEPSCSHYALDALRRHGAIIGSWLAVRRIVRCHPWSDGGYDPVPAPNRVRRVPPAHGGGAAPRSTVCR